MKVIKTRLPGCVVIEPAVFGDERGFFYEGWNAARFAEHGLPTQFVQHNVSRSQRGVLRGLHYQWPDSVQGKLVSVIEGEVFDVAVDLRRNSATFGKWEGVVLSAENKKQFYIPEGFAHGFAVLSDHAAFVYKCTRLYDPSDEGGLQWDDPEIGVKWPLPAGAVPLLSEKDKKNPSLKNLNWAF